MGWCEVPDCPNIALTSSLCRKHELDRTIKQVHGRKENGMKVKVTEGYQVKGSDGKVHTSGVIEMKDADARNAIAAGYVTESKEKKTTRGKE
jgi:hypothetical protein